MNIAFVWDWTPNIQQTLDWRDGLAAALKELGKRGNTVFVIVPGEEDTTLHHPYFDIAMTTDVVKLVKQIKPNVILHWGDFTRPHAEPLSKLGIPQAICFAGGECPHYTSPYFDHIFVESMVYRERLEEKSYDNVSIAFGTNTELYTPVEQPKVFDTVFPATFAAWKRHELYAQATEGLVSLAVGYMYENHEQECWQTCISHGVAVLPHVSAEALHRIYAASRVCVVPSMSSGGSQRTVLEAMAMNLPLIITDSDKFDYAYGLAFEAEPNSNSIRGFINAILDGQQETNTRDYVLKHWSEQKYADALEAGLEKIL